MNRREAIAALSAAPLILAASSPAAAAAAPPPSAADAGGAAAALAPKPLPFDAKKLHGLSEKLITSHHDNNYAGAVKNLAKVREQIAATNKDTPPFVVGALRERELQFHGSMVLHELYFGNLGGDGKASAAGALVKALPSDWEARLRATAMSLGGGSGWATIGMSLHTGELSINWSGNHTQNDPFSAPLVVIDMYEHAYAIDYGAAAKDYVDAVFANLNWSVADARYERAMKARAAFAS